LLSYQKFFKAPTESFIDDGIRAAEPERERVKLDKKELRRLENVSKKLLTVHPVVRKNLVIG